MYKTAYIFAAMSLAIAAPAMAAVTGHLGVDISISGKTKVEHIAFFRRLAKPDAYNLRQNCTTKINLLTDRERTFCTDIKQ